jgi:hypothetical protein
MPADRVLDRVFNELASGRVIRAAERPGLGIGERSIEALLDALAGSRGVLLHGTGEVIPAGTALRLSPGRERGGRRREWEGFATDVAGIAMIKALFSNAGATLRYPIVISAASPLQLTIEGWRPEVERPRGYVHLIGPTDRFEREGASWQWVTSHADVEFGGCVEIERSDFHYPVIRRPAFGEPR